MTFVSRKLGTENSQRAARRDRSNSISGAWDDAAEGGARRARSTVAAAGRLGNKAADFIRLEVASGTSLLRRKKTNLSSAEKEVQRRRQAIKSIVIYIIFMGVYTAATLRDVVNDDRFYFSNTLKGQFTENEFSEEFSPTWGKSFNDIATVEEYYQWMQSAFTSTGFASTSTFDGGAWSEVPAGRTMTYSQTLGAVRIAQLRTKRRDCELPERLRTTGAKLPVRLRCYGDDGGAFSSETEDTADFGAYEPPYPFPDPFPSAGDGYDNRTTGAAAAAAAAGPAFLADGRSVAFRREGIYAKTGAPVNPDGLLGPGTFSVQQERSAWYSSFSSKKMSHVYPSPTHAILLDPQDGLEANTAIILKLAQSKFIDLHTRAVFVDVAVFNPMLDVVCQVEGATRQLAPSQFPIPDSQFPIPSSQLPTPNSQLPTPNPTPSSQLPTQLPAHTHVAA
jgi:hypothetical protein